MLSQSLKIPPNSLKLQKTNILKKEMKIS
jgi:hypothetical protein